jgi:tRNA A37 methylthiotransferase MiaB
MHLLLKKNVVLLNPPGRRVYLRDYFCSKVSQADYLNHPIDFIYLSGLLREHYELHLIDAIVDRLSVQKCLRMIQVLQPAAIIGLIGSVSYQEDVAFYRLLADKQKMPLFLIGDVLIENRTERLQELNFAAGFLHDFSCDDVHHFLQGERDNLRNMTFRHHGEIVTAPIIRPRCENFELPVPAHELFLGKDYRYPFVRRRQFATVMTEFGCPYRCTFCIMSTLGWKIRPVHNVMAELETVHRLGIREIFFLDQTFGLQKPRALQLLQEMQRRRYHFGWVCFSRPDVLDDETLAEMKKAGCHTVILGLESGDEAVLAAAQKDYNRDEVLAGFQRCAEHGLRTVATVIIGLPEETEASFQRTLDFLRKVRCDFASFNVAVPRLGTPLRRQAIAQKLISPSLQVMDQSGSEVAMPTLTLSREQINAMHQRAVREYYFKMGYLLNRIRRLRSFDDARIQFRQGYGLLRNYFRKGMR